METIKQRKTLQMQSLLPGRAALPQHSPAGVELRSYGRHGPRPYRWRRSAQGQLLRAHGAPGPGAGSDLREELQESFVDAGLPGAAAAEPGRGPCRNKK